MLRLYLCCCVILHASALKAPNASRAVSTRARGAGAVVAVSGAALVAVSIDVNTLHAVAPSIDDAARHWAANHAGGNDNSLGRVLSDIAPGLGVPCAAASLALVARRGADALRVVAPLGVGFGAFVQGFSGVLKDATQRIRPDPLHHSTYSFPSSHTASATFLAGAFLAVLVPALLGDDEEEFWTWTPTTVASVAGVTALTAAGRILTESHFLSDTLAGAALGIGALGATALVSSRSNG